MATSSYGAADNVQHDRGMGEWYVHIYKPEGAKVCGPYKGYLSINKDYHTISVATKSPTGNAVLKCIASIPSQNVAYVEDGAYIQQVEE